MTPLPVAYGSEWEPAGGGQPSSSSHLRVSAYTKGRSLPRGSGSASYRAAMALDLYAGIPVSDYEAAKPWYERLLGVEPSFIAHATEAVWELAEHRSLFIEEDAERAGGASHTILVDDLDARVADIASRGIEPDERITYPGKARKAIYRDADGNEIGFGGVIDPVGA